MGEKNLRGAGKPNPPVGELKMTEKKPTFEDLYANPYIQESVNTIVAAIVKVHPRLQMYSDDIKQELWLQINDAIPDYSPHGKARMETFFRRLLDRRGVNVAKHFLLDDAIAQGYVELKEEINPSSSKKSSFQLALLKADLETVFKKLTAEQRQICEWIMDGDSFRTIAKRKGLTQYFLIKDYIQPIKDVFSVEKLDRYLSNESADC